MGGVLHRQTTRLRGYDYSEIGAYFITICTRGRECILGEVSEGSMILSRLGGLVASCWGAIPDHFPAVSLDVWTIMPNHVHGILVIGARRGTACRAPTQERFGEPVAGSLPTIVRSYKAAVTRLARRACLAESVWQRSYFDHVIRGEEELSRIREYILNNPLRWNLDEENPAHRI
jgi:REP element-mobilizing transposase RayT